MIVLKTVNSWHLIICGELGHVKKSWKCWVYSYIYLEWVIFFPKTFWHFQRMMSQWWFSECYRVVFSLPVPVRHALWKVQYFKTVQEHHKCVWMYPCRTSSPHPSCDIAIVIIHKKTKRTLLKVLRNVFCHNARQINKINYVIKVLMSEIRFARTEIIQFFVIYIPEQVWFTFFDEVISFSLFFESCA